MVTTKFKVESVKPTYASDGYTIHLVPVVSGSEENETFYKYTPGGQIILSSLNEKATEYFIEGKEYYIDFHKAER